MNRTTLETKTPLAPAHRDRETILQYLQTRHPANFQRLYRKYADKVFHKCLSLLKDESLARDARQEIFQKIFLNLRKFDGHSRFSTWVYSITYNHCIDRIRKGRRLRTVPLEHVGPMPEFENGVAEKVDLEKRIRRLEEILERMSPAEKALLVQKYQEGRSIKEIAGELGITESALKMRLKRAKHKVSKLYRATFGSEF
ncbi:MAG: RNA polymerase sigma factor [Bacteroidetes bacterium]|nr:MAG: RNA polymerase sigma factor [Bacteroidota bacterium]